MLCLEIEHRGQAEKGFLVDAVDVTVGGARGARVRLLPRDRKSPPGLSPLRLGLHKQYNLLCAVEFLSSLISEKEALLGSLVSASSLSEELQRPVKITMSRQSCSSSLSHGNDAGARVVGGKEEVYSLVNRFLCAGTACSTSPRNGPRHRVRQTVSAARTPSTAPSYYPGISLITKPRLASISPRRPG